MRSRKCNEIPQMPKGMASDLRQHDCNAASIHPTTDPNTMQWGPTAPASTQREGVDLRSRNAQTHGQRLQPRPAPNLEAPRRSRDPKRRAGLTGSCCRGAGHDEGEKEGSNEGLPGRNSLSRPGSVQRQAHARRTQMGKRRPHWCKHLGVPIGNDLAQGKWWGEKINVTHGPVLPGAAPHTSVV